jgi:leucyl-tRNA synthetase
MGPDGQKMSKSKGNVINPDEFVREYGADAVRIYLAFIGPYNEPGSYPWNLDGVASMRKFLERINRLVEKHCGHPVSTFVVDTGCPQEIQQALARAGAKVAEDGDRFKFNTSVAALMMLLNDLEAASVVPPAALSAFVCMLASFAPHLAEHLWEKLGGEGSVHSQSWPAMALTESLEKEVVVQVNGKRRGSILLAAGATEEEATAAARAHGAVAAFLKGGDIQRVIYLPGKIINLVV